MSEGTKLFLKNAGHVAITALVSVLIAILQAWLARQGTHEIPAANPDVAGTVALGISAIKRFKIS